LQACAQVLGQLVSATVLHDIDPAYYDKRIELYEADYRQAVQELVNSLNVKMFDPVANKGEAGDDEWTKELMNMPCEHSFVSVGEETVCAYCGISPFMSKETPDHAELRTPATDHTSNKGEAAMNGNDIALHIATEPAHHCTHAYVLNASGDYECSLCHRVEYAPVNVPDTHHAASKMVPGVDKQVFSDEDEHAKQICDMCGKPYINCNCPF